MNTNIIIGFSKSKHKFPIIGDLIMLCEKTNFSHTYIKFYSKSLDRNLIYQANGAGVFFVGEAFFKEHNMEIEEYPIPVDEAGRTKILQWAIDESGKQYGTLQLLGILIKRIFKKFNCNVPNLFKNGNKNYICAELVLKGIEHFDKDLLKDMDFDSAGLNDVRDCVKRIIANNP